MAVQREGPEGAGFLFSLCKDDIVRLEGEKAGLWVVKKIYKQVLLVPINDSRLESERSFFAPTVGGLQKANARKLSISPLGELSPSHD